MRILFAGSPGIAAPSLNAVIHLTHATLAGVLTNPDSPQGRRNDYQPTAVGAAAAAAGITTLKPEKLDAAARAAVEALAPDMLVSFAYGRIFGPRFLSLFRLGGINIHPSLLPKYRGASPLQAALLNRDAETGISIQKLALEMDSGDILAQERFPLSGRETTASLSEIVAEKAAALLALVLEAGIFTGEPQHEAEATFCPRIVKEEGLIRWSLDAETLDARIRAFTPWPLSWTMHKGEKLFILAAKPFEGADAGAAPGTVLGTDEEAGVLIQTGAGILGVTRLQYQTKKALDWKTFLNGALSLMKAKL